MAKEFSELDLKMQLLMRGAMRNLKNSGELPSGFTDFALKEMDKDLVSTLARPTIRKSVKRWWEFWK